VTADVKISRLSITAFIISLIPLCAAPAILVAALLPSKLPTTLVPAMEAAQDLLRLLGCTALAAAPALGIISLVKISRQKPHLKGAPFAWVAILLPSILLLCFLLAPLLVGWALILDLAR
jgi:hypothetical protein